MTRDELIQQIERLIRSSGNPHTVAGSFAEVCEFLRVYAGPNNSFLKTVQSFGPLEVGHDGAATGMVNILRSYLQFVKAGLNSNISPERKAQLDVVSDYLEMAQSLLDSKDVHAAAPAVLIGASLEEFLRTWVESAGLPLGHRKPALEAYSQVLREAELISKQDGKDITSWAGIRNHAAHGEWAEVADKARIRLMLEGVNLFMRKYSV